MKILFRSTFAFSSVLVALSVMAANVDLDDSRMAGNAQIQYSSCVMQRVQTAAGIGSQLRSRGWLQLFSTSD